MLASDLKYITDGNIADILMDISELERMLKALIRSLEEKTSTP